MTDTLTEIVAALRAPQENGDNGIALGVILVFHHVVQPSHRVFDPLLTVSTSQLEQVITAFRAAECEFVAMDDVCHRVAPNAPPPPRPFVCITFDDGYRDTLQLALPLLQRHRVPVCVNIATGYVDRVVPAWWDALAALVMERESLELWGEGATETIAAATWDQKWAAYQRLSALVYRDVVSARSPLGASWEANGFDPIAATDRCIMNWRDVKALQSEPLVSVGAHTVSHRSLAHLVTIEARAEIVQSRATLEKKLGVMSEHLAYPFGRTDNCGAREFRMAADAGFRTGVTTRWSNVHREDSARPLALPRKYLSWIPSPAHAPE